MRPPKLYEIVLVRRDGYRHYGEVLSRLTPNGTYMVRMVPGHPGTLVETSAAALETCLPSAVKWVHYATVAGSGSFPVDMLRYDMAAPLNFNPDTLEIYPIFGLDVRVVCQASNRRMPTWTPARWGSFLWSVREQKTLAYTPGVDS